jgi:DNA-binding transcriptional LysR family regulator
VLRELESIMGRLGAMVQGEEFYPARSQERFRVAMTDHGSTILLPALLERVRKAAPQARLEISAWRTQAYEDVAAGRIDLALSAEAVPPTLESEVIFNLDFVCLVGSFESVDSHSRNICSSRTRWSKLWLVSKPWWIVRWRSLA